MTGTAYPELQSCMLAVAIKVLASEPNESQSTKEEKRWGTRGSFSVDIKKGTWFSHEEGEGGGVLDLLRIRKGLDVKAAWAWLREHKFVEPEPEYEGPARIVTTYDYVYPSGELVCQVCRYEPKDFRQRRPDPENPGRWLWKTAGLKIPVYRLPEVIEAIRANATIYVAEGEKGVEALRTLSVTATCSPGGAGKWRPHHSGYLTGADVVILPDNDAPGRDHANKVAKAIKSLARRVRIVELPDLPEKGDPHDWVAVGGSAEQLVKLADAAPAIGTRKTKPTPDPDAPPLTIDGYPFTEDGIAMAFAASHQETLRYDHTRGSWYVWTGRAWRQDETRVAFSWARKICREMGQKAAKEGTPKISTSKAATAGAVERFAISDPSLAVTSVIWDADIYLLGTPDGTVDLRTGLIRAPDPLDYITRLTAVSPAPVPECPLWMAFLSQVTGHDSGLIEFLRSWFGYCLTGDTREQALVFAHGLGGNGKGVLLNTVSKIMGDYCRNAAMETFTASTGDKHPTDLAMLRGARMVTASETEEGRAWAESRIKQLTGGDKITARFMRQDFFEYFPQFKLTMIGNHKPILRNVGDAERRRFNMVPFDFKPHPPDHELEQKLVAEWPAILRWMIEGCLSWRKNGLQRPKVLLDATAEYFSDQDIVSQWIEQNCDLGEKKFCETTADLFKSWSAFALSNGEQTRTTKWLTQIILRQPGCKSTKDVPGNRGKRGFFGIQLRRPDIRDITEPGNYDR